LCVLETTKEQKYLVRKLLNILLKGKNMSANIDVLNPGKRKRVLLVAANPSVSKQTGWPIGF
jgi:hypothetical protein